MTTRWDGVQLNGSKDFVTTGDAVQWLLVSAREEGADESPRLGLFAVEPTAAGVALTPGPSLPIVPDILMPACSWLARRRSDWPAMAGVTTSNFSVPMRICTCWPR